MDDPLLTLIIDPSTLVREKLAAALRHRVGLDPANQAVHVLVADGGVKARVLLALMGQQALALLAEGISPGLQPRAISQITGIAPGSVRPALLRLGSDRLVSQDDGGAYFIPVAVLDKAIAIVTGAPITEAA